MVMIPVLEVVFLTLLQEVVEEVWLIIVNAVLPNVIFGKSASQMPSESTAVRVYADSFLSNRAFLY